MATVYLAFQESVQREVALKIMSPTLLADPDFGERFLREARIAAKLHHRHVVGVHDVGRSGDFHYIAMEYLDGESLLVKDGTPRSPEFSLRVTREIAMALNYAHSKGFVHRDIKPDNILLREDGSAVLTDFGIARASDSATRMTRTGTVVGTPHYMSPEQARGRSVDGRADLYSLGVVLYELLTGRVPFQAEDSLAVGIMHITQPIPVLPEQMHNLQPLLNRLLAKQPEDRFQAGEAVSDAIEQIEIANASGATAILPGVKPAEDTEATRPLQRPHKTDADESYYRSEPRLGSIDDIAEAPQRRPRNRGTPRPATRHRRKRYVFGVVLILLLGVGGFALWHYQNRLRALLPSTELNSLIARGDKALTAGKLIGPGSAREMYEAARALDVDNDQARQGLNKVGQRLIVEGHAAIAHNELQAADKDLAAADEVLGGGADVEQLRKDLHAAQTRNTKSGQLLSAGDAALAAGKLFGSGSATAAYQQVLDADPTNALALNGLKKVAKAVAQQARDAISAGNINDANEKIADLTRLSPNDPAIPELRAAIANQHADTRQVLDRQLDHANAQMQSGKLGGNDGAIALFRAILKQVPGSKAASQGLQKAAKTLIGQANRALDDDKIEQAGRLLSLAASASPKQPELSRAKSRLRETRERLEIRKQQAQITPADQAKVKKLLADGEKAMQAGNLITPPVDCAYDKYRAVLRIDGNNAQALAGLAKIPARAKTMFAQAIKDGRPNRARAYIDAIAQSNPGDSSVASMRAKLADVFLDQAEKHISDGRRSAAASDLRNARELAPDNPRIGPLIQKLQARPTG